MARLFARVGIHFEAVNMGWNGVIGSEKRVPAEYHPDRYLFGRECGSDWGRRSGRSGKAAFLLGGRVYLLGMPSFDIVSEVNSMEIENAVNQANKELANRFDFKGSTARIVLEKNEIKLSAEDQFRVKTLVEMVLGRLAKRQISLKNVEKGEPDISPLGHARQVIKIKQGLEPAAAKEVTGFIRDTKLKVTTQIQGNAIRVSGKSKDELQAVIGAVQGQEFPVALQFQNFRD
jgi:cyclic-di-GMP-binding protein